MFRTSIARSAAAFVALLPLAACGGSDEPSPGASPSQQRYYDQYVALGDSYTAAPFVGAVSIDDVCIRSGINYPRLIARSLSSSLLDRSCTSAGVMHLTESQDVEGTAVPPQLEAVSPRTDLVTFGMGANPAASQAWFTTCPELRAANPEGTPCRDHFRKGGKDEIVKLLRQGRKQNVAALQAIRKRAPEARILVIGYPAIFPEKGDCPDRLELTPGDLEYAAQILTMLNKTLRAAAEDADVEYLDVHAATKGHDICAEDPWIQGKKPEAGVAVAYHPRAAEQRAVADLVIRHLR